MNRLLTVLVSVAVILMALMIQPVEARKGDRPQYCDKYPERPKCQLFTPSPTISPTLAPTATLSPTAVPTATLGPTPTLLPTASPTLSPSPSPSPTATPSPSPTATATPTPTPTPAPTDPAWTPDTLYLQRFATAGLGAWRWEDWLSTQGLVNTNCRAAGGSYHGSADTTAMTSIQSDGLHLRVERIPGSANMFRSAVLGTRDRVQFMGGWFEAKITYPAGRGFWPAFWLLKGNGTTGRRDEIDVLEAYPNPADATWLNRYQITTHSVINGVDTQHSINVDRAGLPYVSHVFGIQWRQNLLIGYLDGVEVGRITANVPWGTPMYLLLNFVVGSWRECADASTPNGDMVVEWVRVRQ